MSVLTDRIAEVLGDHWLMNYQDDDGPPFYYCSCGKQWTALDSYCLHTAQLIAEVLHLVEEKHWFRTVGGVDGEWQHAVVGWMPAEQATP